MSNYKAPDNSLHFLDDDAFAYLLPKGSVPITDAEAADLQPKTPAATPLQQIADIEAANPITHRMLRELTLSVAQIASAVTGKPPEENKAVRDIEALEAEIAVLRQKAKEQGLIP